MINGQGTNEMNLENYLRNVLQTGESDVYELVEENEPCLPRRSERLTKVHDYKAMHNGKEDIVLLADDVNANSICDVA